MTQEKKVRKPKQKLVLPIISIDVKQPLTPQVEPGIRETVDFLFNELPKFDEGNYAASRRASSTLRSLIRDLKGISRVLSAKKAEVKAERLKASENPGL